MNTLNYFLGGESFAVTLSNDIPKRFNEPVNYIAIQGYGYVQLVEPDHRWAIPEFVNIGGTSYALLQTGSEARFNGSRLHSSTAVTVNVDQYDFGNVTDGVSDFRKLEVLRATKPNSTLFASNNTGNSFYAAGGDFNFFDGGLGSDSYYLDKAGALIVGWGTGVEMWLDGTAFAKDVSDDGVTPDSSGRIRKAYNRFDLGSFAHGSDNLRVTGTVTGIYCDLVDKTVNNATKNYGIFHAAVTYTDSDGTERVVLLTDIVKSPNKTVWKTNIIEVRSFNIVHDGSLYSVNELNQLAYEWADFPEDLRPTLIRLYQMYTQSPYFNSLYDLEPVHQTLPDWLGGESD